MSSRPPASALERARFGPLRTLNVRVSLLTAEESARRVEAWLRSKQVELSGDVLVISGRGAGSTGGVPVVKNATLRVLNRLRRLKVVETFGEDTPGSFVVTLAPLRALLEAPARRRTPAPSAPRRKASILGLKPQTRDRLLYLAGRSLDVLGVKRATESQVAVEMERQFSLIVRSAPSGIDIDKWMDSAVTRALREYEDDY